MTSASGKCSNSNKTRIGDQGPANERIALRYGSHCGAINVFIVFDDIVLPIRHS